MRHAFDSVNVSTVIFNDNKQVLLAKRSMREDVYPGLWCIPGGKLDVTNCDEGVIEKNLLREVREEVGIEIKLLSYVASNSLVSEDEAKLYMIFISKYISGNATALDDTDDVRWFNIEDISEDMLTPKTYKNIARAYNMLSRFD